jgi:hypothetical protein
VPDALIHVTDGRTDGYEEVRGNFRDYANTLKYGKVMAESNNGYEVYPKYNDVRITKHSGAFVQPLLQWKSNKYCECASVALSIQHAMRMRHIVICGLPRSTTFFHISQMARYRKKLLNVKYVFRVSLQRLSKTVFILRRNERDITENAYWTSHKGKMCIIAQKRPDDGHQ